MPTVERPATLRPPLKWAGGKRWQVPHLQPLWETHARRRLVEPFCGGLAVTLGLVPERASLNDANPHLINFYRWLQKGLRVDLPMENDETLFYQHRDRFNALLAAGKGTSREAAALFYYLNRTGYNGLCRFNAKGGFNVPFGRYAQIGYTRDFTPYRDVFADWTFICTDVEAVPAARGALEQRRPDRPRFGPAALRTAEALRPSELHQVRAAGVSRRESALELRQGPRIIFHGPVRYILGSP